MDIVDAPSPQKLIFDGLMSSQISEIESLGGHTYNRPELLHKLLHKQKQHNEIHKDLGLNKRHWFGHILIGPR